MSLSLTLKSLQSTEMVNVEVPDSYTLQELQTISLLLVPTDTIPGRTYDFFLKPPSLSTSLKSLGVNSGDVILFSRTNPIPPRTDRIPPPDNRYYWSELSSIKQVWSTEELQDDDHHHGSNYFRHKLLFLAIHAAFLDSGFVLCNPVSGIRISRFRFSRKWPSVTRFTIAYTLAKKNVAVSSFPVLRFQSIENDHILGYGYLYGKGHLIRIDANRFLPGMKLAWAGCDEEEVERTAAEFWRIVKVGFVLPLLTDVWRPTTLALLAPFAALPGDVKLKILRLHEQKLKNKDNSS